MKVKDLMTKNVISVGSGDVLTHALSKMKTNRIHQLVVAEGKSAVGMLELKTIITKDVDPSVTKVANYVKKVPSVSPEDDIAATIEALLGSGVRALPVVDKEELIGVISETDIMKIAAKMVDKNATLAEITTPCVYVNRDEKASKIRNLMMETNVSRIPVLEGDDVIGVVGTLDLIKVLEAKHSAGQKGGRTTERGVTEKMKTTDVAAEAVMSKPVVLNSEKKIVDSIPLLQKNEEVVVKNGEIGIITPKDVLELLHKPKRKGVYVQITGMQEEDIAFKAKMDSAVQEFVQKYSRMTDRMEYLAVHVEKMHKQGPKQKYSIRIRFKAPFGFFVAHSWGWRPIDVIQDAFKNLEREVMKKYGQIRSHEKLQKSKERRRM